MTKRPFLNPNFNPSDVGVDNGNYFGMTFSCEDAKLILISVPWDVTSSYGGGSSCAPDAIIGASTQLDFYDPIAQDEWQKGIATMGVDYSIQDRSTRLRSDAKKVIDFLTGGGLRFEEHLLPRRIEKINTASKELNKQVYTECSKWLSDSKYVGLVGGDHSVSLGYIKALAEQAGDFGVLHIDAHCDLRKAYEGFTYSHASIMYNVLNEVPEVSKIVQVGQRDYCQEEVDLISSSERVVMFDDFLLAAERFEGVSWKEQCGRIIEQLPDKVYVSFDIDALSTYNCPSTGTPVTGGLSFNQAIYLIKSVVDSGRTIIGFDLVEITTNHNNEWDANVGARVLFKLCGQLLKSNK